MHARDDVDLGGQRADVTQAAAVDAVVLGQDAAAHDLALQLLERVAELLLLLGLVHVGELVRQHILDVLLDLGDAVLTRQLLRNGQRLVQIGVSDLVDAGVQLVGVLREELELLGLLGGDALELGSGSTRSCRHRPRSSRSRRRRCPPRGRRPRSRTRRAHARSNAGTQPTGHRSTPDGRRRPGPRTADRRSSWRRRRRSAR